MCKQIRKLNKEQKRCKKTIIKIEIILLYHSQSHSHTFSFFFISRLLLPQNVFVFRENATMHTQRIQMM